MTAIESVREIMNKTGTSLSDLTEYADLGTKSNISQMLSRNDLKVSTFVAMLETMGYQLIASSMESDYDIIIDY